MALKNSEIITYNIKAHDRIAPEYDVRHEEIFNSTEQKRISNVLQKAFGCIETVSERKLILDFGAGTGNLTRHLIELNADVVAADVSTKCLEVIESKFGLSNNLSTFLLNGSDLSGIKDNSLDLIAAYSVLHHVPDYLGIVAELIRTLKPGGILLIDHEVLSSYWTYDRRYIDYLCELDSTSCCNHLYELGITKRNVDMTFNIEWLVKLVFLLKRHIYKYLPKDGTIGEDGDIHTFLYDHIEWDKIKAACDSRCSVLAETDYLVCREVADSPVVWNKWADSVADMKCMMLRKN